MYRNVFYNQRKRSIRCWSWDEKGRRISFDTPYEPYIYVESQEGSDATSIYNTPLKRLNFKTQYDRFKYVKDSGLGRIFYNLQVDQQFLIEQYSGVNETKEFSEHPLKIFFLDIEVDSPNEFPEAEEAKHPINLITIVDSLTNHSYTWGLHQPYTPKRDTSHYFQCQSESELLTKFIDFWKKDYPDCVSGWNSEDFDIPYIINRITRCLGEEYARQLSPVASLRYRENVKKKWGQVSGKWLIHGVSCIDYMELYRIFSPSEKASYSLDNIAREELGESKNAINATSLSRLAATDWDSFVDYNIQDTDLLIKLEESLRYLAILRMLSYIGLTTLEQSLGTITIVTGAFANEALKRNQIISTFPSGQAQNYEGGLVLDPKRGLKECVVGFDANSLYPNTMVTLNLSPETKMGKVINQTDDKIEVMLTNGKCKVLEKEQFVTFLQENDLALSKAKILFSQSKTGICPALLKRIYANRVENKRLLKEHKIALNRCKEGTPKFLEHTSMVKHLDIMQYTLKILMNRIYGGYANRYSPFYDIDLAESITGTGQSCIRQAAKIINNYVNEKYNVDEDILIYGDTDSCYITIKPVLDKLKKEWFSGNDESPISISAYHIVENIEKELNEKIKLWGKKSLNSNSCAFEFERESMSDVGIFVQKKRYILHMQDDGGIVGTKTKYVGVEVVRSSTPKRVKPLIKNIIEMMISSGDRQKTNDVLAESYEAFKKLSIEDTAFPKSITDYDKYGSTSNNFKTAKGCPIHVKSAIYYNNFLDSLNLTHKYEKIRSGNKIKFFYAQPNRYNVNTIGFVDVFPPEIQIKMDIDKMFEKLVIKPVEQLYALVQWHMKKPNDNHTLDLFELLG